MNKLFVVKFMYRNKYSNGEFVIACKNFWNQQDALKEIEAVKPFGWRFKVVENNDIHKIWEGR